MRSTQMLRSCSRVWSLIAWDSFVVKSCTPLAFVVESLFCIFFSITTSSGGKEVRSRGRGVEDKGEL